MSTPHNRPGDEQEPPISSLEPRRLAFANVRGHGVVIRNLSHTHQFVRQASLPEGVFGRETEGRDIYWLETTGGWRLVKPADAAWDPIVRMYNEPERYGGRLLSDNELPYDTPDE